MDLKEIGINTRNWVDSAQDRDYWSSCKNVALNLRLHKTRSLLVSYGLRAREPQTFVIL
jgi:hypothetical protein